jgi:adenylate cyclase
MVDSRVSSADELDRTQLATLIEASRLLNATLERDEVWRRLMALAAKGVDADRVTLYLVDEPKCELRSVVMLGKELHEIRLPLEEGLAGYVARTDEVVNVVDAYADERFSPRIDQETGYGTRTVLAVPLRDSQGEIRGVVQALNKRQGLLFSEEDERYLLALAEHAALALENARLHADLAADCRRLSFLYRVGSLITGLESSDAAQLRDVLLSVMADFTEVLDVESSAILLWDRRRRRLAFVAAAGPQERELMETDVPLEGSIAGWIIQNEKGAIVNDVQDDPRFFPGVDARTGLITRTLVGAPVKMRGKVIGVLEAMNRRGGDLFGEADLQLAQAAAGYLGLAVEDVQHYEDLLRVGGNRERQGIAGFLDSLSFRSRS